MSRLVKFRKIENHNCTLSCKPSDKALTDFIKAGIFVNLRRKFRKLFMVSESNPESKIHLKSTAHIHEEYQKHLDKYYYMIHPFSAFRMMWETVMAVVFLFLLLIFIPLELYFLIHTPDFVIYSKVSLDIICYVDVVINFYTGFWDQKLQKVVLKPSKVAKRYIFSHYFIDGFFLIDVLSSLPVTVLINMFEYFNLYYLKAIWILKLFRLPTMFTYINRFLDRRNAFKSSLSTIHLSLCYIITILWTVGITIFVLTLTMKQELLNVTLLNVQSVAYFLVQTCTKIVECLMLVGPDPMSLDEAWQLKVFNIFYIMMGSVINLVILSSLLRIHKSRNTSHNKQQVLLQEIIQYMDYREMSPDLKEKVMRYIDFKYRRRIPKEEEIMNTLSQILREEIMLHNCQNLINRVDFFKEMPKSVLMKIVVKLKPEVYLKHEVIFQAGTTPHAMYFIYVGSVSIFGGDGIEIVHYNEGKHFGEISLLNNSQRLYTAVARSDCELLRLSRKDLTEVLMPYPKICAKLAAMGSEKEKRLKNMLRRLSVINSGLF